jgi:DNA-binding Lrp family transcriptional regulator
MTKKGERALKDRELKLISELLKSSDRSDRQLAKVLGTSQPTVSRMLQRLKREGVIKEHTIIPDFRKLGIELVAMTFGVWSPENIKEYSEDEHVEKETRFLSGHPNVVFASSGQGLRKGRIVITLHKDYADYSQFMREAKSEWGGLVELESFVISLETDVAPFPFSFRNSGEYLEK